MQWKYLTHVLFAFGSVISNYTVIIPSQYEPIATSLFSAAASNGVSPVLSIGGYGQNSAQFSGMVSSNFTRKAFIDSTVALVEKYGLKGIDVDWEYPARGNSEGIHTMRQMMSPTCSFSSANFDVRSAGTSRSPWSSRLRNLGQGTFPHFPGISIGER